MLFANSPFVLVSRRNSYFAILPAGFGLNADIYPFRLLLRAWFVAYRYQFPHDRETSSAE
ncbi:hypothetical protein ANO14919_003960 [Xylariales sp. No.14919]|nr:hypothetical protein ANO14919_003960 [Xylariales sp. No.14919]